MKFIITCILILSPLFLKANIIDIIRNNTYIGYNYNNTKIESFNTLSIMLSNENDYGGYLLEIQKVLDKNSNINHMHNIGAFIKIPNPLEFNLRVLLEQYTIDYINLKNKDVDMNGYSLGIGIQIPINSKINLSTNYKEVFLEHQTIFGEEMKVFAVYLNFKF